MSRTAVTAPRRHRGRSGAHELQEPPSEVTTAVRGRVGSVTANWEAASGGPGGSRSRRGSSPTANLDGDAGSPEHVSHAGSSPRLQIAGAVRVECGRSCAAPNPESAGAESEATSRRRPSRSCEWCRALRTPEAGSAMLRAGSKPAAQPGPPSMHDIWRLAYVTNNRYR